MVGRRILQNENARGAIRAIANDIPSGDNAAVSLCHHAFEYEDAAWREQLVQVRALQELLRMIGVAGFLGIGRIREDEMKARAGFCEPAQ